MKLFGFKLKKLLVFNFGGPKKEGIDIYDDTCRRMNDTFEVTLGDLNWFLIIFCFFIVILQVSNKIAFLMNCLIIDYVVILRFSNISPNHHWKSSKTFRSVLGIQRIYIQSQNTSAADPGHVIVHFWKMKKFRNFVKILNFSKQW